MLTIVPVFMVLLLVIFVCAMAWAISRSIETNRSPLETAQATVVRKKKTTDFSMVGDCMSTETIYIVTFETSDGACREFRVPRREFDLMVEGDQGYLSFQRSRYRGFERTTSSCAI